jgi:hypothetical protein
MGSLKILTTHETRELSFVDRVIADHWIPRQLNWDLGLRNDGFASICHQIWQKISFHWQFHSNLKEF